MKITKLQLKNYQQFKNLTLDFTHPDTGEPLRKICFIGRNGTGKTTILDRLFFILKKILSKQILISKASLFVGDSKNGEKVRIELQIDATEKLFLVMYSEDYLLVDKNLETHFDYFSENERIKQDEVQSQTLKHISNIRKERTNSLSYIKGENPIFNQAIPESSVDEALKFLDNFPTVNEISNATVNDFWKMLIYHIKKNESDRYDFENSEKNLDKTKRELVEEFDSQHPDIKVELKGLWDKILANAQLYFDSDAKNPVQLTDNLNAYIKRIADGQNIPYNKLSTGIKNFIFQLGHVFAIHFNRKIDNAFLLADEPAQGLFPDFIYDLVGMYEQVVGENTQIFMATHNPIIASQFEPYERFILDFDEEGYVTVKRGTAPIGDDPNDILHDDFEVENLMPQQGIDQWNKYKDLKRQIYHLTKDKSPQNGEKDKLDNLIKDMAEIGRKYKF